MPTCNFGVTKVSSGLTVSKFYPSKCRCFSIHRVTVGQITSSGSYPTNTCTRAWKLGFGSISGQKPSSGWVLEGEQHSDNQGFMFAPFEMT